MTRRPLEGRSVGLTDAERAPSGPLASAPAGRSLPPLSEPPMPAPGAPPTTPY